MGLRPDDFWDMTFYELGLLAEAYKKRKIEERNNLIITAWHSALFERQKKLPELKSLLMSVEKNSARKKQSTQEMITMAKILNAAYGGEFKEIKNGNILS